jgi:hypothetical protein
MLEQVSIAIREFGIEFLDITTAGATSAQQGKGKGKMEKKKEEKGIKG